MAPNGARYFVLRGYGCRQREWVACSPTAAEEPPNADTHQISVQPSYHSINTTVRYFPSNWHFDRTTGHVVVRPSVASATAPIRPPNAPAPLRRAPLPQSKGANGASAEAVAAAAAIKIENSAPTPVSVGTPNEPVQKAPTPPSKSVGNKGDVVMGETRRKSTSNVPSVMESVHSKRGTPIENPKDAGKVKKHRVDPDAILPMKDEQRLGETPQRTKAVSDDMKATASVKRHRDEVVNSPEEYRRAKSPRPLGNRAPDRTVENLTKRAGRAPGGAVITEAPPVSRRVPAVDVELGRKFLVAFFDGLCNHAKSNSVLMPKNLKDKKTYLAKIRSQLPPLEKLSPLLSHKNAVPDGVYVADVQMAEQLGVKKNINAVARKRSPVPPEQNERVILRNNDEVATPFVIAEKDFDSVLKIYKRWNNIENLSVDVSSLREDSILFQQIGDCFAKKSGNRFIRSELVLSHLVEFPNSTNILGILIEILKTLDMKKPSRRLNDTLTVISHLTQFALTLSTRVSEIFGVSWKGGKDNSTKSLRIKDAYSSFTQKIAATKLENGSTLITIIKGFYNMYDKHERGNDDLSKKLEFIGTNAVKTFTKLKEIFQKMKPSESTRSSSPSASSNEKLATVPNRPTKPIDDSRSASRPNKASEAEVDKRIARRSDTKEIEERIDDSRATKRTETSIEIEVDKRSVRRNELNEIEKRVDDSRTSKRTSWPSEIEHDKRFSRRNEGSEIEKRVDERSSKRITKLSEGVVDKRSSRRSEDIEKHSSRHSELKQAELSVRIPRRKEKDNKDTDRYNIPRRNESGRGSSSKASAGPSGSASIPRSTPSFARSVPKHSSGSARPSTPKLSIPNLQGETKSKGSSPTLRSAPGRLEQEKEKGGGNHSLRSWRDGKTSTVNGAGRSGTGNSRDGPAAAAAARKVLRKSGEGKNGGKRRVILPNECVEKAQKKIIKAPVSKFSKVVSKEVIQRDILETLFHDCGHSWNSSLLHSNNENQQALVEERSHQLSLGSVVAFYGMVREFIHGKAQVNDHWRRTGEFEPVRRHEYLEIPDIRQLNAIARNSEQLERNRRSGR